MAYGFASYSLQDGKSRLAFAKAKVAPMEPKSLPTLELLAVFLAIKCLLPLLKAYSRIRIGDIVISVDSQVVLSWLLSENIKTKNQFVKNRLEDVHQTITELKEEKSLSVKFRYVHTDQNPADLLTWGITSEKFQQNLRLWSLGLEWLSKSLIECPTSELQCLSSKNKLIVLPTSLNSTLTNSEPQPVIPFDKSSSSSRRVASTDIPDPLSPLLPIVHRLRQVFRATSRILT